MVGGATVVVFNSSGLTSDIATVTLPAANWTVVTDHGVVAKRFRYLMTVFRHLPRPVFRRLKF